MKPHRQAPQDGAFSTSKEQESRLTGTYRNSPSVFAADSEKGPARLDVDLGADVSLPTAGIGASVAISPDGARLVFAWGGPSKLFARRLDQSKATELSGTQGASSAFFSVGGA